MRAILDCKEESRYIHMGSSSMMSFRLAAMELGLQKQQQNNQKRVAIDSEREGEREKRERGPKR
jgi:hypothetical protein